MTQEAGGAGCPQAQVAALARDLRSCLTRRYSCAHAPTTNSETTGHSLRSASAGNREPSQEAGPGI